MLSELTNVIKVTASAFQQLAKETAIDKNGEYRLKGLNPGNKYVIKVKIPQNSCK